MPEKKTTANKKTAARKATAKKTVAKTATPKRAVAKPAAPPPAPAAPAQPSGACPRCGTSKFAPEQRIRAEGSRTVRYEVLVCERGHTFARPRSPRT